MRWPCEKNVMVVTGLILMLLLAEWSAPASAQTCEDTVSIADTITVTRRAGTRDSTIFSVTNATPCPVTVFFDWFDARVDFSVLPYEPRSIPASASIPVTVSISWYPYTPPCNPGVGTYYHSVKVIVNDTEYKMIIIREVVTDPDPLCDVVIAGLYGGVPLKVGMALQFEEMVSLDLTWECECSFCQAECPMSNTWEYSTDNGATWHLFQDLDYWQYFSWSVPNIPSTKTFVRVTGFDFFGLPFSNMIGPLTLVADPVTCCAGATGNVDASGIVDLGDLSFLVSYLVSAPGTAVLPCQSEANVNLLGIVDLSDLSQLIRYLTIPGESLPNCPR